MKPIDQWQVFDDTDPKTMQLEFGRGELQPETTYYVRISAKNADGEGVMSIPVQFATLSGGIDLYFRLK